MVVHSVADHIVAKAHEGEIGQRLKQAGARVGALTCSLLWNNTDVRTHHSKQWTHGSLVCVVFIFLCMGNQRQYLIHVWLQDLDLHCMTPSGDHIHWNM